MGVHVCVCTHLGGLSCVSLCVCVCVHLAPPNSCAPALCTDLARVPPFPSLSQPGPACPSMATKELRWGDQDTPTRDPVLGTRELQWLWGAVPIGCLRYRVPWV